MIKLSFVMLSLLLFVTGISVEAQTPSPNPDRLIQDCVRNLQPDRPILKGSNAPSIKIIAPVSKTVIVSDEATLVDVNFTVEVQNWKLPGFYTEDAVQHWHLWLNDSVWGMFYQTQIRSGIPYGTWRICASLGDSDHRDVGMPDAILLTVERGESQTAVVTVQQPQTQENNPSQILPILLIMMLGGLALTIGFLIGRRVDHD